MKFELNEPMRGATDEEFLVELRRCAKELGKHTLTRSDFKEHGKCSSTTIERRFGTWSRALETAGLRLNQAKSGMSDEELFKNIKSIWVELGRQPKYSEVKYPISNFSVMPYQTRFGNWTKALQAFIEWVNSEDIDNTNEEPSSSENISDSTISKTPAKRRTSRNISERHRFRILVRDGFHCQSCGASPIKERGVELHIDHILPWSKGGETIDENLECKCSKCNLGKGNAFDV